MKLYSVSDRYIAYLQNEHPHVYSNYGDNYMHTRKYLGAVTKIMDCNYFIPLSSPKARDYVIEADGSRSIKKDTFLIFRIRSGPDDNQRLRGSLYFSHMIPVPENELIPYDPEQETDIGYKNLVYEEIEYFRKNENKIVKRANLVYKKKLSGIEDATTSICLDFAGMELMHNEWLEQYEQ